MKLKKSILILTLFVVGICLIGAVNAVSDNATDIISEIDFKDEISVSNNEHTSNIESDYVLSAQENSDDLSVIDEKQLSSLDDEDDDFEFEYEDEDDEDDEILELDNDTIDEFIEDIHLSNSKVYFDFFKFLMSYGFKFNSKSIEQDGYLLSASQKYELILYGTKVVIMPGGTYFIPTSERPNYNFGNYYSDTIYYRNDQLYVDMLYLDWQNKVNILHSKNFNFINSKGNFEDKFDLRNVDGMNYVTPVKDQKQWDNCWAFASIAGLESHLLLTENKTYDFSNLDYSENNLKNVMSSIGSIGTDKVVNSGGNFLMSIAYFLRWSGPINEINDKYMSNSVFEIYKSVKHVQGIGYIHKRNSFKDNDEIKHAIKNYGGVITSIFWDFDLFAKNESYFADIRGNFSDITNHAILIIGWDDNYAAENFKSRPSGDGAFIIKNSWGETSGNKGYYYVSYFDTTIASSNSLLAGFYFTDVENNTNYGKQYSYTPLGFNDIINANESNNSIMINQWVANKNESLEACGFHTFSPCVCEIDVEVEGKHRENLIVTLNRSGYHTIKFNKPIEIKNGEKFVVMVSIINLQGNYNYIAIERNMLGYSKVTSKPYQSFLYFKYNGSFILYDLNYESSSNICINVYTKYEGLISTKIDVNDVKVPYGKYGTLSGILKDSNNVPLKGMGVLVKYDKVAILKTDDGGKFYLNVYNNKVEKQNDIQICYFGNEIYDSSEKFVKIKVTQIPTKLHITSSKYVYADKNIKFNLKTISGQPISGTVHINVNGKKYEAKTNKLGSCTFKTNKKNFKAKKNVIVEFGGDNTYLSSSSSIKIKQKEITISGVKTTIKYNNKMVLKLKGEKTTLKISVKIDNKKKNKKLNFKKGKIEINLYKMYALKKTGTYKFVFYCNGNYYLKLNKKIKFTK